MTPKAQKTAATNQGLVSHVKKSRLVPRRRNRGPTDGIPTKQTNKRAHLTQERTEQDRTGEHRTGQDRTGQERTGQDWKGQDRTGQDRTRISRELPSSTIEWDFDLLFFQQEADYITGKVKGEGKTPLGSSPQYWGSTPWVANCGEKVRSGFWYVTRLRSGVLSLNP